jgi:hypothetical protein
MKRLYDSWDRKVRNMLVKNTVPYMELMTIWLVGSHLSCALRSVLKREPIQLAKSMNYFEIKNTYSTFWFVFYA